MMFKMNHLMFGINRRNMNKKVTKMKEKMLYIFMKLTQSLIQFITYFLILKCYSAHV